MAEIAKMSTDEQWAYQMSLKQKRHWYGIQRTLLHKGKDEKALQVAVKLLKAGSLPTEAIAEAINKDLSFVQHIQAQINKGAL